MSAYVSVLEGLNETITFAGARTPARGHLIEVPTIDVAQIHAQTLGGVRPVACLERLGFRIQRERI